MKLTSDVDAETAIWLCLPNDTQRHATTRKPGALVQGSTITALCDESVGVPLTTYGREEPRTARVTDRCPECTDAVEALGIPSEDWNP